MGHGIVSPWKRHDPEYEEKLASRLASRIQPAGRYKPHRQGAKVTAELVRCIRKRHVAAYADLKPTKAAKRLAEEYPELKYMSIYDLITYRSWRNIE